MIDGLQEKNKRSPDEGKAILGNGDGEDEKNATHNPEGDVPLSTLRNCRNRITLIKANTVEQLCGLEKPRQYRRVGDHIPDPSLKGISGNINVIPVLQGKVYQLEEKPQGDGPEHQEEKLLGPTHEERIPLHLVDEAIADEDVRPPGQTIEPRKERLNPPEHHNFGKDQDPKSDDPMDIEPVLAMFRYHQRYHSMRSSIALFPISSSGKPRVESGVSDLFTIKTKGHQSRKRRNVMAKGRMDFPNLYGVFQERNDITANSEKCESKCL